jgi:hypothetical protein
LENYHGTNRVDATAGVHSPPASIKGANNMSLRRFIIERDIPSVGTLQREELRGAAAKSNEALQKIGTDIQWIESYVADNKTFCVYLAKDEDVIRKHAEISGFPATKITEIRKIIDPTTERAA